VERLTSPCWSNRNYSCYANVYPKRKDMEPAFQKILNRLGQYEDTNLTPSDIADLRNELCLLCGKYKTAHLGACDHCKWAQATASKRIKEETYGQA